MLGEENIPLVARADETNADPISVELFVAEVGGTQPTAPAAPALRKSRRLTLESFNPFETRLKFSAADLDLFRRQLHGRNPLISTRRMAGAGLAERRLPGIRDAENRRSMPNHWPVGMAGNRQKGDDFNQVFIDDETVFGAGRFEQFFDARPGRNGQIKRQAATRRRQSPPMRVASPTINRPPMAIRAQIVGVVDPLLCRSTVRERAAGELCGRQVACGLPCLKSDSRARTGFTSSARSF